MSLPVFCNCCKRHGGRRCAPGGCDLSEDRPVSASMCSSSTVPDVLGALALILLIVSCGLPDWTTTEATVVGGGASSAQKGDVYLGSVLRAALPFDPFPGHAFP